MSDTDTTSDSTTSSSSTTTSTKSGERDPVLAVDLDETIIQPETNELVPGAREALLKLHDLGWKIIIWTARGDDDVPDILKHLGIPYDALNENLPGIKDKSRKIHFDAVVDNKNVNFEKGWEHVIKELEHRRKGWKHAGVTKVNVCRMNPKTGEVTIEQTWGLDEKGQAVVIEGEDLEKDVSEVAVPVANGKEFLKELLRSVNGTYCWAEAG